MNQYAILLVAAAALILLLLPARKTPACQRLPLTLSAARLLRRMGRWLWALGEAVEIGFFHARRVRHRFNIEINTSPSGDEQ